uniref:Uncharacterized protein n=1 Tax=Anopheles farauti TaxID=69004 RepID=A0A182QVS7_9DIPT
MSKPNDYNSRKRFAFDIDMEIEAELTTKSKPVLVRLPVQSGVPGSRQVAFPRQVSCQLSVASLFALATLFPSSTNRLPSSSPSLQRPKSSFGKGFQPETKQTKKMSARGMLLKCDMNSSFDQPDPAILMTPRSPAILLNDYFSPEG